MKALRLLAASAAGLLFGAGLVVSGLAVPERVLAFLRLGPGWDPTLLVVMVAALAVTVPGFALLRRSRQPWLAPAFPPAPGAPVDLRLLAGAAVFGLGWGLAGYCPGPAFVAAGLGQWQALLFVPAMFAGAALSDYMSPSRKATTLDPSTRRL